MRLPTLIAYTKAAFAGTEAPELELLLVLLELLEEVLVLLDDELLLELLDEDPLLPPQPVIVKPAVSRANTKTLEWLCLSEPRL